MRTTTTSVLAAACLALAACGGDQQEPAAGGGRDAAFDGAVKFARCMREQGIDVPDPQQGERGQVRIGGPGFDPGSPKAEAARKACGKFLAAGGGPAQSPAEQAKAQDAFVRYARCMRGEGIDMPDPKAGAGGIVTRVGEGPDPQSPAFEAADAKCHPILAELDPKLERR